jgi:hypothetical protein
MDRKDALLAQAPPDTPSAWDDVRLQRLWLATARRDWRSLAVVGTDASTDTLPLAGLLAQLVWRYRGQPSMVCDLRDLTMRLVDYQVREMHTQADPGARVLIALRSIFENPTALLVAREADAVLLCIGLGTTAFRQAEQTIKEIGRDRIVGSVILGANGKSRRSPRRAR